MTGFMYAATELAVRTAVFVAKESGKECISTNDGGAFAGLGGVFDLFTGALGYLLFKSWPFMAGIAALAIVFCALSDKARKYMRGFGIILITPVAAILAILVVTVVVANINGRC